MPKIRLEGALPLTLRTRRIKAEVVTAGMLAIGVIILEICKQKKGMKLLSRPLEKSVSYNTECEQEKLNSSELHACGCSHAKSSRPNGSLHITGYVRNLESANLKRKRRCHTSVTRDLSGRNRDVPQLHSHYRKPPGYGTYDRGGRIQPRLAHWVI